MEDLGASPRGAGTGLLRACALRARSRKRDACGPCASLAREALLGADGVAANESLVFAEVLRVLLQFIGADVSCTGL